MRELYQKPLRVYIALGFLALWGVLSGLQLPISLFPKSSQSTIAVNISFGEQTPQQFFETVGRGLEAKLQALVINQVRVKEVQSEYRNQKVTYRVIFSWGVDPEEARRQIESVSMASLTGQSENIRRTLQVESWRENQGFFAVSFFSSHRSLDELYDLLEPFVSQINSQVPDAANLGLYNPNKKEVRITLNPEKMAAFKLTTLQVSRAIEEALASQNGGSARFGEKDYQLILPKTALSIAQLKDIPLSDNKGLNAVLRDIADVSLTPAEDSGGKFKTNSIDSLILFGSPKEGGNIKKMSDDILSQLRLLQPQWPEDVEFKILVNPSDFINNSILGVAKEVGLAALLAVFVLLIFIGSFKNVITAAIEIPLSLVMAFIFMKMADMNLNLISLGGLALSAGMNVDASVVVMENIFRYLEKHKEKLSAEQKLTVIIQAVNEVKLPIIASTIASLVVFIPLIMTQGLTNALLGDLAKAVVFSHGLSAVVALILVPTIRLHLMRSESHAVHFKSPIEKQLLWLENSYAKALDFLIRSRVLQATFFSALMVILGALIFVVGPKLKKEIIGRPDTDWLIVGIYSPVFNSPREMEAELDNLEQDLIEKFGSFIDYTFYQLNSATNGNIMLRLHDKKNITNLTKQVEDSYVNKPTMNYWVDQWNPSELEIPDPPPLRVELVGGDDGLRTNVASELSLLLNESQLFSRIRNMPDISKNTIIQITPNRQSQTDRGSLRHYLKVATNGAWVADITEKNQTYPLILRINKDRMANLDQIRALPVGIDSKVLPLSSFAQFSYAAKDPMIYRENQRSLVLLQGRMNESMKGKTKEALLQTTQVVDKFKKELATNPKNPTIVMVDTDQELNEALKQLSYAVAISILLIFITMIFQFGDIIHSLLVLVAIPLGFIGVITALFAFGSTLSLNSGLGTILLNGIAVANSIILVDFMKKLFDQGRSAREAAIEAAKTRLRPILMTSLTTVLGMLPISLGLGEGGKILQPLGVAVCGGLWISMLLTLFVVPTLQYLYLERKSKKISYLYPQHQIIEKNLEAET